jgi:hypothetical protein
VKPIKKGFFRGFWLIFHQAESSTVSYSGGARRGGGNDLDRDEIIEGCGQARRMMIATG